MSMNAKDALPFRTTLSLPEQTGKRLKMMAKQQGITVLQVVRRAIEEYGRPELLNMAEGGSIARQQARSLLELTQEFENPYQEKLASWRIARTRRQIADVRASRLELDAWPAEIYLLRVLTELLQKLGDGDEFLVATNLGFWRTASAAESAQKQSATASDGSLSAMALPPSLLGPESSALYLSAQRDAVARGMRLKRVFLLSKKDSTTGAAALDMHRRLLHDLDDEQRRRVQICCRVVDDLDAAVVRTGHFACVRRINSAATPFSVLEPDFGAFVVEPVYQGHHIRHLRLLFSQGQSSQDDPTVKFYLDRFFAAADELATIPLDQIPEASPALSRDEFRPFGV
jgi:hypothetical protein